MMLGSLNGAGLNKRMVRFLTLACLSLLAPCSLFLAPLPFAFPLRVLLAPSPVQFSNVTQSAGIRFEHFRGNQGTSTILEEAGPGVCVADYDADGYQDITSSMAATLTSEASRPATPCTATTAMARLPT